METILRSAVFRHPVKPDQELHSRKRGAQTPQVRGLEHPQNIAAHGQSADLQFFQQSGVHGHSPFPRFRPDRLTARRDPQALPCRPVPPRSLHPGHTGNTGNTKKPPIKKELGRQDDEESPRTSCFGCPGVAFVTTKPPLQNEFGISGAQENSRRQIGRASCRERV